VYVCARVCVCVCCGWWYCHKVTSIFVKLGQRMKIIYTKVILVISIVHNLV